MKRKDTRLVHLKRKRYCERRKGLPYVDKKRRQAQEAEARVKQKAGVLGAATPQTHCTDRNQTQGDTAFRPQSMSHFFNTLAHKLSQYTAVGQHYPRCSSVKLSIKPEDHIF